MLNLMDIYSAFLVDSGCFLSKLYRGVVGNPPKSFLFLTCIYTRMFKDVAPHSANGYPVIFS